MIHEIDEDTKTAWRMATDSSNRQGVRAVATTTTDPHRSEKRAVAARGAAGALALSILAVVLQSAATATPTWGYFTNPDGESCFWNSFDRDARIFLIHSEVMHASIAHARGHIATFRVHGCDIDYLSIYFIVRIKYRLKMEIWWKSYENDMYVIIIIFSLALIYFWFLYL